MHPFIAQNIVFGAVLYHGLGRLASPLPDGGYNWVPMLLISMLATCLLSHRHSLATLHLLNQISQISQFIRDFDNNLSNKLIKSQIIQNLRNLLMSSKSCCGYLFTNINT